MDHPQHQPPDTLRHLRGPLRLLLHRVLYRVVCLTKAKNGGPSTRRQKYIQVGIGISMLLSIDFLKLASWLLSTSHMSLSYIASGHVYYSLSVVLGVVLVG